MAWVRMHRKLTDDPLWLAEPFTRGQAWVDLFTLAAYKPGHVRINGARIDYQRGQYVTAIRFLGNRWKWSNGKVIRFLNELEMDTRIGTISNARSTVITILNYDAYQADGTENGTMTGTLTERRRNADGTPTEQSRKKDKKYKNIYRRKTSKFTIPTVEEVAAYIVAKGYHFTAERFIAHYGAKGWVVGKSPMKSWKQACVTWEQNYLEKNPPPSSRLPTPEEDAEWTP